MPDLQTEIFKKVLPNMNNLKFDDSVDDTPEVIVQEPAEAPNVSRAIWEYIKAHPDCLVGDIRSGLNIPRNGISTRLNQMCHRGNLLVARTDEGMRYRVAGDTYKALSREETLQRAIAAGAAARKRKNVKARIKMAEQKLKKPAKVKATPVVHEAPKSTSNLLETMSIIQARELYDQLKKIFGG